MAPLPVTDPPANEALPSSPPPLPLVSGSTVPEEEEEEEEVPTCQNPIPDYPMLHLLASAVLAHSLVPKSDSENACQSTPTCEDQSPVQRKPRTKRKSRTMRQMSCQNLSPVRTMQKKIPGQSDTHRSPNREIVMEASQIDTNEGDQEVSDRPATEMAPPESDTRNSCTPAAPLRNVIPVSVYTGGEVKFNQIGAEYSIPPIFTFAGTQQTTFDDVRSEICNCLKLSEDQFSLNIQARYNVVPSGPFFFTLLAINDERAWQMVYEMAVSGTNWRIIELYVKLVPNQSPQNANPDPAHSHGTSSISQHSTLIHATPSPHNPSQTKPHSAPVRGSCSRPNTTPSSSLSTSSRTRHNKNKHAKPSQTKQKKSPLKGSCTSPLVPNNPNPSRRGDSSKAQCLHDNPSKTARFTQGQGPSPPELIPFADVGSFSANQIFKSKKHLWFAITDLHTKANIEFVVISSSESELVVRCKNSSCQWKLHATPTRVCSNWTIKTCLYPHTCHEATSKLIPAELTVELIARIISLDIEQGSELKIIKLHELVLKVFPGEQASYSNLWHARKMVIEELFGGWEESYALLPQLFEAIKASNPETQFDLRSDSMAQSRNQQFNRVAWAFGPCINAYRFLRPVISVKALSLLGKYDGRLLIASGYDADNQHVPLAFALVNEDTESNLTWFMRFLRQKVIGHNQLVCIISDYDGSMKSAFKGPYDYLDKVMLQAVHRFCSLNVADCLSKVCKDIEMIDLFKFAAKKTSPQKFEECRNAIRVRSPETYLFLERLGKRNPQGQHQQATTVKWAQCEDSGYRYGIMNSNCSEMVKKVFKGCRHLPLAAIVENTFSNCMRLFSQRRQNAAEQLAAGRVFSDTVTGILQRRGYKAQGYYVKLYCSVFNTKIYEVVVKPTRDLKYTVTVTSTSNPECECRKLKLTGIPCSHVIAVCRKENVDPERFVNSHYSLEMLADTWSADFHLYGNQTEWPEYNGAVVVPDKTLLRTEPRKPGNHKDSGENSGKK